MKKINEFIKNGALFVEYDEPLEGQNLSRKEIKDKIKALKW